MIVPMKKATVIFEASLTEATVRELRKLGVLHIEHVNRPEGRDLSALSEQISAIDSALGIIRQAEGDEKTLLKQIPIPGDARSLADHITMLRKRKEQLESTIGATIRKIDEWKRWGDIDAAQVRQLNGNGIIFRLYQVPVRETGNFPDHVVVKVIFTTNDIAHCVAIARKSFECGFTEVSPPEEGVSSLERRLASQNAELAEVNKELVRSAGYSEDLDRVRKELLKELEFRQVLSGMGREGAIAYITGYIPQHLQAHLIARAESMKWGVLITDPAADDNVPTMLSNPPWVNRIRPVFDLLGITPGYQEIDVSVLFLIFFSIFFGILIGDAGYGLVYILLTLILQRKVQPGAELKTMFSLFYLLGSCAVAWGVMTGTFFGQSWVLDMGFKPLVPQLNDAGFMGTVCFFLGALHLSLAHTWRAYLKLPSLTALADIGYISILWAAFFIAKTLILGDPFPDFGLWLVAAGVILVVLFTSPQANVLRGIGEGLGTIALSFMNNITDVISYIRLYAVGLATLAVAETTNYLASSLGSGAIALVAGVVIILFGHSLNIILGPMSVLVHGVRLNVLEFSGHANVTWSGFAFDPFRE